MTDAELLARFEDATLPGATFDHAAHVRAAWLILREDPLPRALTRFSAGLRRLAAALGAAGKYHETVTWAFMVLIHERLERHGRGLGWEEFAAACPELLDRGVLRRYYRDETLASPLARRVFVLPDRPGLTVSSSAPSPGPAAPEARP
jgi:hypothetical protein